jgi:dihydrofolate reductase
MGRVTYETLAQYDDGSGPLSTMPKLVVSRTLTSGAWGQTTIVGSDHALEALKREPGPPLRVIGSVSLVQRLLAAGALDRLRLVIFPLVLGESGAERLFEHLPDLSLALAGTEVLDNRLIVLDYRPTP